MHMKLQASFTTFKNILIEQDYTGCLCQGVGSGGDTGVALVRRGQGCPVPDKGSSIRLQKTHGRTQLSSSAKMAAPWRKHRNIRKRKQCHTGRRAGNRKTGKQQREDQGQRRRCSTLQSRYCLAAHGEEHARANIHCSPWRTHTRASGYVLEGLWPMENPQWSRFFP